MNPAAILKLISDLAEQNLALQARVAELEAKAEPAEPDSPNDGLGP